VARIYNQLIPIQLPPTRHCLSSASAHCATSGFYSRADRIQLHSRTSVPSERKRSFITVGDTAFPELELSLCQDSALRIESFQQHSRVRPLPLDSALCIESQTAFSSTPEFVLSRCQDLAQLKSDTLPRSRAQARENTASFSTSSYTDSSPAELKLARCKEPALAVHRNKQSQQRQLDCLESRWHPFHPSEAGLRTTTKSSSKRSSTGSKTSRLVLSYLCIVKVSRTQIDHVANATLMHHNVCAASALHSCLRLNCFCAALALRLRCAFDRIAFMLRFRCVSVCTAFALRLSCDRTAFALHLRCICAAFLLRSHCVRCVHTSFVLRSYCVRARSRCFQAAIGLLLRCVRAAI
jgi:hypothetical protein